jgi:phosphate transport system substrate-binding protein
MRSVWTFFKILLITLASLLAVIAVVVAITIAVSAWKSDHSPKNLVNTKDVIDKSFGKEVVSEEVDLSVYRPFSPNNLLVKVKPDSTFTFTALDAPRLDGATAAYPVYAAAAQYLYSPEAAAAQIQMSNTPRAYERLIDGEVDVIFVAQPSQAQKKAAAEKNIQLTLTPMGREAFVFLVSEKNSLRSLTIQQIRDVYSGRIQRWDEVGGGGETIMAFQRPPNSGSQTVMLAKVMQGEKMREPLQEEKVRGMGGAVKRVASYRNAAQSIGYSFRFYATKMQNTAGIKLLAVNGTEPSIENIRNGTYPFTVDVFMVTAGEPKPSTRKLMDWVLSAPGQKLIQDTGYVPLK